MNIAVISPHTQKNGNTTVAALIANELATRNRKVCLTHTRNQSNSFYCYFGISNVEDKTCNPTQIYHLIKDGGIDKNDISDYCKGISENFELFTMNSKEITKEQLAEVSTFISSSFPHDYIVYDFDDNHLNSPVNAAILERCDCVIYVLSQTITELIEFNKYKEEYLSLLETIPVIVVVNRYSDIVSNLKSVAMSIGIKKPKKWFKISYNSWIPHCQNNGIMNNLFENMQKRNYQLVDIDSDIKAIVSGILSVKHTKHMNKYEEIQNIHSKKDRTPLEGVISTAKAQ